MCACKASGQLDGYQSLEVGATSVTGLSLVNLV